MPRLRVSTAAQEQLDLLPELLRNAVLTTLAFVRADPWHAGRPLRGGMRGVRSAKVGSYRVLYTIEGSETRATVVVRGVKHRALAYRRRRQK